MSPPFALLFPGQGSQSIGMLAELAAEQSLVENLFKTASDVLNYDLWQLVQSGPIEKLEQTEFTQPAMLVADVAVFQCWQALGGGMPVVMAGHSLGEYAALVCAGAIRFEEAVQIVKHRGQYMQEAVPVGIGAMGAIVGLDPEQLNAICHDPDVMQNDIVSPANFNSIGQTVIAGHKAAVIRALEKAKQEGAKIAKLIPVSVPSHCALMEPAALRLAEDLLQVDILSPKTLVIHNADVMAHKNPESIRRVLINQLVSPVRWVESIQAMVSQENINHFFEAGPGKVLAGLNRRIFPEYPTLPLHSTNAIVAAIQSL